MTFRRWLACILGVFAAAAVALVALTVLAVHILRLPNYPHLRQDLFMEAQERPFAMRNQDCQILVYGDSSAMTGADPAVLTAATGMTACDIAAPLPTLWGLGTFPLDRYLERNPKPKFLVFEFAPSEAYAQRDWNKLGAIYTFSLLVRLRPTRDAVKAILEHPVAMVRVVRAVLTDRYFPERTKQAAYDAAYKKPFEDFYADNGHLTMNAPPETRCEMPPGFPAAALDGAWLRDFRRRYEAEGMHVLLRASPLPECDANLARYAAELAPYIDGRVEAYPILLFNNEDAHFTTEGSRRQSLELAAMIRSRQAEIEAGAAK